MGDEGLPDQRQDVRRQFVVMVEEQGDLRLGQVERGVGGQGDALGFSVGD